MLRSTSRTGAALLRNTRPRVHPSTRRFLSSSSPADKSRTWKSSALRWGAAVGAVYWYNTSPIFADEPALKTIPAPPAFVDDDRQTVDAVIEEKRRKAAAAAAAREPPKVEQTTTMAPPPAATTQATVSADAAGSPAALEEEADQQGAFNPETGEINWDCPCLGGMAHGPCGEEFKTAFSCFVFSKEEPKGMDCIDKFQGMQECFKKYPEIYGSELAEDEAEAEDGESAPADATAALAQPPPESPENPDGSVAMAATEATVSTTKLGSDDSTSPTGSVPALATPPPEPTTLITEPSAQTANERRP